MRSCLSLFLCTVIGCGDSAAPSSQHKTRGEEWYRQEEYEKAIDEFSESIRLNPYDADAYAKRGDSWYQLGKYDKVIADYDAAIRLDPNDAMVHNNRGLTWCNKSEYDMALADFNEAIRIDPKNASAHNNRGNLWRRAKKDYDKAIDDYTTAIRLAPNEDDAYYNRGETWCRKKEYERALADFNEAIRLDPNDFHAYDGRAWLWATCSNASYRDGEQAVASATKACEITGWRFGHCLQTLAAAYAEAGDFDNAITYCEQALSLARRRGEKLSISVSKGLLKSFRAAKPWRGG